MGNLNGGDWAILLVSGYVAVTSLVRLMLARRDRLIAEFRQKMAEEQRRMKVEAKKAATTAKKKAA